MCFIAFKFHKFFNKAFFFKKKLIFHWQKVNTLIASGQYVLL